MIEFTTQQLLRNSALTIVMLFALDWRESRWARRATRRDRAHLRPVRRCRRGSRGVRASKGELNFQRVRRPVRLTGATAGEKNLMSSETRPIQVASTAEQQQHLAAMPSYRLVSHPRGGGVEYSYADPGKGTCVYVDGSIEYSQYQHLTMARQIAQEEVRAEQAARNRGPWVWR